MRCIRSFSDRQGGDKMTCKKSLWIGGAIAESTLESILLDIDATKYPCKCGHYFDGVTEIREYSKTVHIILECSSCNRTKRLIADKDEEMGLILRR